MKKAKKIIALKLVFVFILLVLLITVFIISAVKINGCLSSISFSISGNGTCDLTLSLSTRYWDGKEYKIVNDNLECSGIINDDGMILCKKQIPFGNYTYTLYIDDKPAETKSISCPEFYILCEPCGGNKTT